MVAVPLIRFAVLLPALLVCCGQEVSVQNITERRVVNGGRLQLGVDSAARFGYARPEQKLLEWQGPASWTELPATKYRLANFAVPGGVECYLSVFPGAAGGVLMNLNRWRDQLGAADLVEDDVARLPKVPMLGSDAVRMEVVGEVGKAPRKLVGLVLVAEDSTVFVKMIGPPEAVDGQQRNIEEFVASVRRTGEAPALRWEVPAGWRTGAARKMRAVTLHPPGADSIECYVTILNGNGGGALMNINRWRRQIELPATDEAAVAELPHRRVLGRESTLVDLQTQESDRGATGLLGIICQLRGRCVFVKMMGPSAAVRAARTGFFTFVDSLKE